MISKPPIGVIGPINLVGIFITSLNVNKYIENEKSNVPTNINLKNIFNEKIKDVCNPIINSPNPCIS